MVVKIIVRLRFANRTFNSGLIVPTRFWKVMKDAFSSSQKNPEKVRNAYPSWITNLLLLQCPLVIAPYLAGSVLKIIQPHKLPIFITFDGFSCALPILTNFISYDCQSSLRRRT